MPSWSWDDPFSGRPNIHLRINVTETVNAAANQSTISWSLQLVEVASQPSYAYDVNNTATLTFGFAADTPGQSLVSGDMTPAIGKWNYDFSAAGNQTKTIGSNSFVVNHGPTGLGKLTVSASATAVSGNIGSAATGTQTFGLSDIYVGVNPPLNVSLVRDDAHTTVTCNYTPQNSPTGAAQTYGFFFSVNGAAWVQNNPTSNNSRALLKTDYVLIHAYSYFDGGSYGIDAGYSYGYPAVPSGTITKNAKTVSMSTATVASSGHPSISAITTPKRSTSSDFSSGVVTHSNGDVLSPGQTYYFRYETTNTVYSTQSAIVSHIMPRLPIVSGQPTVEKVPGQSFKRLISWTAATVDTPDVLRSYLVEASIDGGSSWLFVGNTSSSATSITTSDLQIAKTYIFKVSAVSDVGSTSYTYTVPEFISAYGYRYISPTEKVAITSAARFTNDVNDSITVNGITYTKWALVQNSKKYVGSQWISLEE